jgi:hypothetical protein
MKIKGSSVSLAVKDMRVAWKEPIERIMNAKPAEKPPEKTKEEKAAKPAEKPKDETTDKKDQNERA